MHRWRFPPVSGVPAHSNEGMDDGVRRKARARKGVVLASDLGDHPRRAATRDELVEIHPGAYVASTQPVDVSVLLAAVRAADGDRDWAAMEETALWLYGLRDLPDELVVGVPLAHKLAVRPPAKTRRVAASVLRGSRWWKSVRVVALEIAILQGASCRSDDETRTLVEGVVRGRRTTLVRLRARCRRGLKGSARVRRVCDALAGGSIDRDVQRLKVALEARGVTGLEVEVRFESETGASAYADLLHRATMTLIEVDGYLTHALRERFRADRRRDRWMHAVHKATTLRVDVLEIQEDLDALADQLAAMLLPPTIAVPA